MRPRSDFNPEQKKAAQVLASFGHPEAHPTIHLAGTNGKGSTGRLLALALEKLTGKRIGHFVSPHVYQYEERILLNSRPIEKDQLRRIQQELGQVLEKLGHDRASYFAKSFLEAMLAFRHCALSVLETGIGGREDLTNIVPSEIQVITSIGRDHEAMLGPYPEGITRNKAGIFSAGGLAFSAPQKEEVKEILLEEAQKRGTKLLFSTDARGGSLHWTGKSYRMAFHYQGGLLSGDYTSGLIGRHQLRNLALALRVLEEILEKPSLLGLEGILPLASSGQAAVSGQPSLEAVRTLVQEAVSKLYLPGRMEMLSSKPFVFVDGAHNDPAILLYLENVAALEKTPPLAGRRKILLFGMHRGKIHPPLLEKLFSAFPDRYQIDIQDKDGEEIAQSCAQALDQAKKKDPQRAIFACGSFYLLEGVRRWVEKEQKA